LTTKLEIVKIDNKRSKPSTDLAQTVDGKLKINSNLFVRIGWKGSINLWKKTHIKL
jgi:hypothetical protein